MMSNPIIRTTSELPIIIPPPPKGDTKDLKVWKEYWEQHDAVIRQDERKKVLDILEQLLCARHKYVGSSRVITGTPEEIYDELFDAMQAIRTPAPEAQ